MATDRPVRGHEEQIISHLTLRILIGLTGAMLPLVIFVVRLISGGWAAVPPSISASWYTPLRDFFVGTLWVLGFFLLSYRGKNFFESFAGNIGWVFALGVAMLPCRSPHSAVRILHIICAAGLLLDFALFSLWLFRDGLKARLGVRHIRNINRVYIACGVIILLSLAALLPVIIAASTAFRERTKIVFILESVALAAFCYSWLTRAHVLWADRKEYPRRLPSR